MKAAAPCGAAPHPPREGRAEPSRRPGRLPGPRRTRVWNGCSTERPWPVPPRAERQRRGTGRRQCESRSWEAGWGACPCRCGHVRVECGRVWWWCREPERRVGRRAATATVLRGTRARARSGAALGATRTTRRRAWGGEPKRGPGAGPVRQGTRTPAGALPEDARGRPTL